jgi:hypothetical protein
MVTVSRAASALTGLIDLKVNAAYAALHPVFKQSHTSYTTTVNYDVDATTLGFTKAHPKSSVAVDGVVLASDTITQKLKLKAGANTTATLVVSAQNPAFKQTYTLKILRAEAPPIHTQLIRGSLRDATCLLTTPTVCHKAQYIISNVKVTAFNPVDNVHSNETYTDEHGVFEIRLPFSVHANGKYAQVQFHWATPSARDNMGGKGTQTIVMMGAYSAVGGGFALDMNTDVGYAYWYPQLKASSITGVVRNALTNEGIEGAMVQLWDENSGSHTGVITTGYEGTFEFKSLAAGLYRIGTSMTGFAALNMTHMPWNSKNVAMVLSPTVPGGKVRIVMSWAEYPGVGSKDMDIHMLFRPSKTDDCDVNYAWQECGKAHLDRDNVQGGQNGAETITIDEPLTTVYTVYLDNYRGDLTVWRDRSSWEVADPRTAELQEAEWMWPPIPKGAFNGVMPNGWATEVSGAVVRVLDSSGEVIKIEVPSHPESPSAAHYYRDKPLTVYDGSYRNESRYVRLLCIDFRGASPQIYKVPMFSATPPVAMLDCQKDAN